MPLEDCVQAQQSGRLVLPDREVNYPALVRRTLYIVGVRFVGVSVCSCEI